MNDAYAFVSTAETLDAIDVRQAIIERLAQQSMGCAYFLRDYAGQNSLGEFIYKAAVPYLSNER